MSPAADCDRIISYEVVCQLVASRSADMPCVRGVPLHPRSPVSDKTNEDSSRVCASTKTFFLLKVEALLRSLFATKDWNVAVWSFR
jgi:hypothetical protein